LKLSKAYLHIIEPHGSKNDDEINAVLCPDSRAVKISINREKNEALKEMVGSGRHNGQLAQLVKKT
jgi:hypothetical protein